MSPVPLMLPPEVDYLFEAGLNPLHPQHKAVWLLNGVDVGVDCVAIVDRMEMGACQFGDNL